MDLKYIEAFLSVVEEGSFSAAARALYITQPTLTNRIKKLEKLLNATLFLRGSGERAVLSDDGKKVLAYYRKGFELIQAGTDLFSLQEPRGVRLIISGPNHLGKQIVSNTVDAIRRLRPNVDFVLEINESPITVEKIAKGEADIGFVYVSYGKGFEEAGGMETHRIAEDAIVLVGAPQHPLAALSAVTVHDLKNHHILRANRTFKSNREVDKYFRRHGITHYKTIENKNIEWLKSLAKNGSGVMFMPRNVVRDELRSGELVELPLDQPLPPIPFFVAFRASLEENIKGHVLRAVKNGFD